MLAKSERKEGQVEGRQSEVSVGGAAVCPGCVQWLLAEHRGLHAACTAGTGAQQLVSGLSLVSTCVCGRALEAGEGAMPRGKWEKSRRYVGPACSR